MNTMEQVEKIKEMFRQKLDSSYQTYMNSLQSIDRPELIERAEEIAVTRLIYEELKYGRYDPEYLEYLLRFQDPLQVVREQWQREQTIVSDEDMGHALWSIADKREAEEYCELDEAFHPQDEGVRLC